MIFENTAVAYKAKDDRSLKQAYTLFRMISNPFLSKCGIPSLRFAVKAHFPVKSIIRATLYKHFIGGETLEESLKLSDKLKSFGMSSVLDFATEGVKSEKDVQAGLTELFKNIDATASNPNLPFAVFKPSAFAPEELMEKLSVGKTLNNEDEGAFNRLRDMYDRIFAYAAERNVTIMIDAEETWTQPIVDQLVNEGMMKYNKGKIIVMNTYQMYRTDRLAIIKEMYQKAVEQDFMLGVKIVRGAYLEKERKRALNMGYPSPVHETKQATDNDFNAAAEFCIEHADRIKLFIGTHNELSCETGMKALEKNNLPKNNPNVWFSQLYGMCDHITFNIAALGYNVNKYIPYGKIEIVIPYLLRRAEENSSVEGQAKKEISLIKKEIDRRKSIK